MGAIETAWESIKQTASGRSNRGAGGVEARLGREQLRPSRAGAENRFRSTPTCTNTESERGYSATAAKRHVSSVTAVSFPFDEHRVPVRTPHRGLQRAVA